MLTFSQLFTNSWTKIFHDKKIFFTIFGLLGGVTLLMQWVLFFMWYNITDQQSMNTLFQDFWGLSLFIAFSIAGLISAFFWMLWLAKVFQWKKVITPAIFQEWKKIFPYIGTLLCFIPYYVGFFLSIIIIIGIGTWAFFIGSMIYSSLLSLPYSLWVIISGIGFVVILLLLIAGIFTSIWLLSSYYSFVIPAFFLDDKKYFSAMSTSRNAIRGRWLRTAGFFCLYILAMLVIFIIIAMTQSNIAPSSIASLFLMFVQTSLQTIFGMFLYTFSFVLYEDYKKHPIPVKKK